MYDRPPRARFRIGCHETEMQIRNRNTSIESNETEPNGVNAHCTIESKSEANQIYLEPSEVIHYYR